MLVSYNYRFTRKHVFMTHASRRSTSMRNWPADRDVAWDTRDDPSMPGGDGSTLRPEYAPVPSAPISGS
jgi:hypothetical protein